MLLAAPATAPAAFPDGASIASASLERLEQGDDTTVFATISRDARYVVFDTRATNFYRDEDPGPPGATRAGGIFRRDTVGGALEKVADGDVLRDADGVLVRRGAHNPSVSADGRYVAFSTAQPLVGADVNDNIDVYRRDMTLSASDPAAYVLVSAKDGGDLPATYAPRPTPLPGRNPGTDVYAGRAISADGNRIALRSDEAASDLPDHALADVPGGQVLVRDVAARTTLLLTRRSDDARPAGGARGPVTLSADGGAVAWVGANAPAQTRFLAGEQLDPSVSFYLYRRLDGFGATTRRITGAADPDDPACDGTPIGSDPTATGPCYGPLADTEQGRGDISQRAPALSADGYTVAFIAAAAGRPANVNNPGPDLFVTDMRPGVSRKAGTRELTREGDPNDPVQSAPVESVSIAADGVHVAIVTLRSRFVLSALAPAGTTFRLQPDARELYAIDLRSTAIERVLRGVGGSDAGGDVGFDPALSGDGATLAFTSTAGNLFVGDANERGDAFWVTRAVVPPSVAPPPPRPRPPQSFEGSEEPAPPRLGVRVRHRRDGALLLAITAPGAGRLIVYARSGTPARTVARSERAIGPKGRATVTLVTRGRDRARLRASRRLRTAIRVRFVPKDRSARALSRLVTTSFTLPKTAARARPAAKHEVPSGRVANAPGSSRARVSTKSRTEGPRRHRRELRRPTHRVAAASRKT